MRSKGTASWLVAHPVGDRGLGRPHQSGGANATVYAIGHRQCSCRASPDSADGRERTRAQRRPLVLGATNPRQIAGATAIFRPDLNRTASDDFTLTPETMWQHMRALLDRVHRALDSETVVDDCLDIIVELLGSDRGLTLLTTSQGSLRVVNARGKNKALRPSEREEASKTVISEAMTTRCCVAWDPLSSQPLPSSFMDLGIVAALAAPLFIGSDRVTPRGALYVDFRDRRRLVDERHVEFFVASATVLGAVLDQHEYGERTRDRLRAAQSHCMDVRETPPLRDLLVSRSMQAIRAELESSVGGTSPVLVLGESGTGKTLLAQAIAEASERRPIVRAVLGSSDDLNTITSELFGHERGAFSGAVSKRVGLVEYADGGTLIFDEILNLPLHAQQLLLDFTQFGTYRPLGHVGREPKQATVRIIAATNGDLPAAIRERRFRSDLYYRLAAVTIELPPLRARREDAPAIAERTLRRIDRGRTWTLAPSLANLLTGPAFDWPGNVRQLEWAIARARERAVARDPAATVLLAEHFEGRDAGGYADLTPPAGSGESLLVAWQRLQGERRALDQRESHFLREALSRSQGVVAQVAREIGIARTTLSSRIDALGLRPAK